MNKKKTTKELLEEIRILESHMDFIKDLNNQLDRKEKQLDIANKKLDEIEEYIKENACYDKKTKECKCSFSSIALDNILSIIGGE
jgi:pyruvate/2-oxoacid:ferredoxin oxidoreductase beta subunit